VTGGGGRDFGPSQYWKQIDATAIKPIDDVTVTGRSMIKLMPMGDFFYDQFMFADKFNLLHLSDAELALLSAVMILNPGQ